MLIGALKTELTGMLSEAGISDAAADVWYLLEAVTGVTRASFFAHPEREVSPEEEARLRSLAGERAKRIPLQHLLGTWEFMGERFLTEPGALIPRQETELLAEESFSLLSAYAENHREENLRVLDLGTGTGCIPISLLLLAKKNPDAFSRLHVTGADLSEDALAVAMRNKALFAERIPEGRLTFLHSDLFSAAEGRFALIVSNPPYIPAAEIEGLEPEVKDHDPYMALSGGEDGLDFYRRITKQAPAFLTKDGALAFEIGKGQSEAVKELLLANGFSDIRIRKDLAGISRVVTGRNAVGKA